MGRKEESTQIAYADCFVLFIQIHTINQLEPRESSADIQSGQGRHKEYQNHVNPRVFG